MPSSSSPVVRRERLLEVSAQLFARWGFDKTSMEDIAREAGISKGAVYLEFPNKDALFKVVLYRESLRYSNDWLRRFQADPGEWSFAQMFRHSVASIAANPLMKALLTRDQRVLGSFFRQDSELLSINAAMGKEFFQALQAEGAIRDDISPAVLAPLLTAIGYGLVAGDEVLPAENRAPFDECLVALGLLLDRGLAPARGGGKRAAKAFLIATVEKTQRALAAAEEAGRGETR